MVEILITIWLCWFFWRLSKLFIQFAKWLLVIFGKFCHLLKKIAIWIVTDQSEDRLAPLPVATPSQLDLTESVKNNKHIAISTSIPKMQDDKRNAIQSTVKLSENNKSIAQSTNISKPRKGMEKWVENVTPPIPKLTNEDLLNTIHWESNEDDSLHTLYFHPPKGVEGTVYVRITEEPNYCEGELLPAIHLTLSLFDHPGACKKRIPAPCAGVVSYPHWITGQSVFVHEALIPGEIIAQLDCDTKRIKEFLAQKQIEKQERIEREQKKRLEQERREIAAKIKEKQRRKTLERDVYNELLAKGELSEVSKRPPIPNWMRHEVWVRDGGKCVICGSRENLQFDHIIPFSKGGATSVENLQILCQKCNIQKSNHI